MIRRLHEIEPPKLSLPSEKSNKSEDPTAKESLASEFKKLLQRARGGLSGARDEVAALGLALSQAVATVHKEQAQLQGPSTVETRETDIDESVVVEDDNLECSTGQGIARVDDTARKTETGPTDEGGDDSHEDLSAEVESLDDGSIDLSDGGEEIALEEEIIYTDLGELNLDEEVVTDALGVGTQVALHQHIVAQNQTEIAERVDGDTKDDWESDFQRVVLGGEEEVEEDPWLEDVASEDALAHVGPSDFNRPLLSSKISRHTTSESYSTGNAEVDRFLAENPTEQTIASFLEGDDFQGRSGIGDGHTTGDIERMFGSQRREMSVWGESSLLKEMSPFREKNGELSMQLSLLRQAYDSLKAQTSSTVDYKSKGSSSGVSAVGAAAEPRATQHEGTPRVAKYLNRATSQKMMERVETALKEAARSRDGKTITLRLEPVQLGQVKCDVSLRDGLLHARITPQNPEVVSAVREHSHELQTALRRLGLNVDRVTVQVLTDKDSGSFAQTQGFLDGKSFQQNGNNMPGKERQTPENTFGNEIADVPKSGTPDAGFTPADHWIA
jgi:hypothetical protein